MSPRDDAAFPDPRPGPRPDPRPRAVVIGAGFGGLAAAVRLGGAGLPRHADRPARRARRPGDGAAPRRLALRSRPHHRHRPAPVRRALDAGRPPHGRRRRAGAPRSLLRDPLRRRRPLPRLRRHRGRAPRSRPPRPRRPRRLRPLHGRGRGHLPHRLRGARRRALRQPARHAPRPAGSRPHPRRPLGPRPCRGAHPRPAPARRAQLPPALHRRQPVPRHRRLQPDRAISSANGACTPPSAAPRRWPRAWPASCGAPAARSASARRPTRSWSATAAPPAYVSPTGETLPADIVVSNADAGAHLPPSAPPRAAPPLDRPAPRPAARLPCRSSSGISARAARAGRWPDVGHHTILMGPRYRGPDRRHLRRPPRPRHEPLSAPPLGHRPDGGAARAATPSTCCRPCRISATAPTGPTPRPIAAPSPPVSRPRCRASPQTIETSHADDARRISATATSRRSAQASPSSRA